MRAKCTQRWKWKHVQAQTKGYPTTLLTTGAALSLLCAFAAASISPALSAEKIDLEPVVVRHVATRFVAPNGSDEGPGTANQPWATINHAAEKAKAGDLVLVHGGRYALSAQVRPRNSGRPSGWITFMGFPGEKAILDAQHVPRSALLQGGLYNGVFQIQNVAYIRVVNLTIINSHGAGITIRDSHDIELINNSTEGTFSSGIAVWDTTHSDKLTQHIRILGNKITKATTWASASADIPKHGEAPHEALSIGGAVDFEVAYNHVYDSDKEGIDIKETSKRGIVHHNLVENVQRQGIYLDAWFGEVSGIEISSNVVHNCHMAGVILSVENGESVASVSIHDNLIFNNDGTGLYFSRWGVDRLRRRIEIRHNVFFHNGYGTPKVDQRYYWMTGGLYLYSTSVRDIFIANNIFSQNRGFQVGYSELLSHGPGSWRKVAHEKNIQIIDNLIDGANAVDSPIESGGDPIDRVNIYAINGTRTIFGNPMFTDPAGQDFALKRGSPAAISRLGPGWLQRGPRSKQWWRSNFPPKLYHVRPPRSVKRTKRHGNCQTASGSAGMMSANVQPSHVGRLTSSVTPFAQARESSFRGVNWSPWWTPANGSKSQPIMLLSRDGGAGLLRERAWFPGIQTSA